MKQPVILSCVVIAVVIFASWCSYGVGYTSGKTDSRKEKPCLLCDRSIKEFHAFRELEIEPDSAIYCKECKRVHLFYPGMEYKDEKPQMKRLQVTAYERLR